MMLWWNNGSVDWKMLLFSLKHRLHRILLLNELLRGPGGFPVAGNRLTPPEMDPIKSSAHLNCSCLSSVWSQFHTNILAWMQRRMCSWREAQTPVLMGLNGVIWSVLILELSLMSLWVFRAAHTWTRRLTQDDLSLEVDADAVSGLLQVERVTSCLL